MPRVNLSQKPQWNIQDDALAMEVYAEMYHHYGGSMSLTQIGQYIGAKDIHTIRNWVSGLQVYAVDGKTKKFRTSDVAKRFAEGRL